MIRALAVLLVLAGCAASPARQSGPRIVTIEQAQLLSQVRFLNYDSGGARFDAEAPLPGGRVARISGSVDWRAHRAAGSLGTAGSSLGRARIAWTPATLTVTPAGGRAATRALAPRVSAVDTLLLLILQLAQSRPENPQLLIQQQASYVRADRSGGVPVAVFRGPAAGKGRTAVAPGEQRTFYWVDADGRLRRFEAHIAGTAQAAWVTFRDWGPQKP